MRAFAAIALPIACVAAFGQNAPSTTAPPAGTTDEGLGYSVLDAIDRDNVARLQLAWSRQIASATRFQGAPAVDDGRLFAASDGELLALDGASGTLLWTASLEAVDARGDASEGVVRGMPAVRDGVVFAAHGTRVSAWDAERGRRIWSTDLADGLAEAITAHPIVAGDRIVVGTGPVNRGAAPGRVAALDAADGTIAWTFFVVPQTEGAPGYDTWSPIPPGWRNGVGGGGVFNRIVYDSTSDAVVFGTGTPAPTERLDPRRRNEGPASADLFTASVVALEAESGKLRWHLPVVPGDEWEYDQDTVPVIASIDLGSVRRRVALFATTTGYVLAISMETGALLRAHLKVPESNVHLGFDNEGASIVDADMRYLGERPMTRVCPAPAWAGAAPGAFDPVSATYYRPNEIACVQRGNRPPIERSEAQPAIDPVWLRSQPRRAGDYYRRWGALTALDPDSGETLWEYATPYPHDAGALATAGGLVFSAFADRTFRAFDARTGETLWTHVLSAHSDGTPVTYVVDGVQYVVVAVGHPTGLPGLPDVGVPDSVAGPVTLFAFALDGMRDMP